MESIAASAIAVLGTLLGAGLTHLFQQRASQRGRVFERDERLRKERIDAFCTYAGVLVDLRRVLVTRWYCMHEGRPQEQTSEARQRSYELRSEAQEALFRIQMLTDSVEVVRQGRETFQAVTEVHHGGNAAELDRRRTEAAELIDHFVVLAKRHTG
ncbi:hypothetical protein [Streptomyces venezuelae]|uniref:hypothetical protein n=1 Tax=Streptomyces venezuelae TaxID=54571 RepID=UPI003794D88A